MRLIADLHIHSKYSRACSKELTPENLSAWAKKKGIGLLGTGDFLHPKWFEELDLLKEVKPGLYGLGEAYFMYTTEISSIYKQGDKVRRVHNLIFSPSREVALKLTQAFEKRGANLKADGRPITGFHCDDLVKICKEVDEKVEVVPAHAWTPHFGVFGSLSGFDSLEEAFGDMSKYIFAIETGLSSDPKMNWQIPFLENIALISNSDPHSLRKLGREANIFEVEEKDLSYDAIIEILKNRNPKEFLSTIEFFPEEGKYHLDGHGDCNFPTTPEQTKKLGGICPVCGKKLLRGVLSRVEDLSSPFVIANEVKQSMNLDAGLPREYPRNDRQRIPFVSTIPLEEIIGDVYGVGPTSKKVQLQYENIVSQIPEFEILLDVQEDRLKEIAGREIADAILKVRQGRVHIEPGYDGHFGKVHIYSKEERDALLLKPKQNALF